MPTSVPALTLEDVGAAYGHVQAVESVSLRATAGEVVALLGPNGAGKSTLLRAVCNQVAKTGGRVLLGEKDISRMPTYRIVRSGVALVPEGRHVIAPLTVNENLLVAAHAAHRQSSREIDSQVERVYELFEPLRRLRDRPTGLLSGGEQQMVAMGRALTMNPTVLLLDEPSMGLAPVIVETIYGFISDHHGLLDETAIVLAEQNRAALGIAADVVVLSRGSVVHAGPTHSLTEQTITEAYLGTTETSAEPDGVESTASPQEAHHS